MISECLGSLEQRIHNKAARTFVAYHEGSTFHSFVYNLHSALRRVVGGVRGDHLVTIQALALPGRLALVIAFCG